MSLNQEIQEIKTHIAILNDHSGSTEKALTDLKVNFAEMKNDISWIKRFFWLIAGASISSLIVGLFNLIIKRSL